MIDNTDLEIIEELKKDGRASYSEIADKLDLATSTVTARVQKLKDENILTGFKPVIDYEKLGFELASMLAITAESDKTIEVAETLKNHGKVISFFEVTGKTDMMIITRFKDRRDMNKFIKSLQKIEGIKSTETHVILTKPKLEDNMDIEEIVE